MESIKQNAGLILALGILAGWVMTAAVLMVRAWRNGWARRAQTRRDSESAELAAEKERFAEQHNQIARERAALQTADTIPPAATQETV